MVWLTVGGAKSRLACYMVNHNILRNKCRWNFAGFKYRTFRRRYLSSRHRVRFFTSYGREPQMQQKCSGNETAPVYLSLCLISPAVNTIVVLPAGGANDFRDSMSFPKMSPCRNIILLGRRAHIAVNAIPIVEYFVGRPKT